MQTSFSIPTPTAVMPEHLLAGDSDPDDDKAQSEVTSKAALVCEDGNEKSVSPTFISEVNLPSVSSEDIVPLASRDIAVDHSQHQSVSPAALKDHDYLNTQNPTPFNCSSCGRYYTNRHSLTRHTKDKHTSNGKTYLCTPCNFETKRLDLFTRHNRTKKHKKQELIFQFFLKPNNM